MNDDGNNVSALVGMIVTGVILVWVLIVLWNVRIPVGGG